jgi:hypothetical protein
MAASNSRDSVAAIPMIMASVTAILSGIAFVSLHISMSE